MSDAYLWKEEYAEFSVAIGNPKVRENVIAALEGLFCLATLIHPLAYISKSAVLNHDCTVMGYSQVDCNAVVTARAVIPKGTKVESGTVWKNRLP